MKKLLIIGIITVLAVFIFAVISQSGSKNKTELSTTVQQTRPTQVQELPQIPKVQTSLPSGAEKIEVLHFHAAHQCISCINIGKFTKATIEEKFPEEYKTGKIVFREVNIDLSENKPIAQDYKVSGSALFINAVKDGQDHREEDSTVWRLVTDEVQLKSYFEAKLKTLL